MDVKLKSDLVARLYMLSENTVVINPESNSEKYNKPHSHDLVAIGKVNRNELLEKLSSLFTDEFLEEVKNHKLVSLGR